MAHAILNGSFKGNSPAQVAPSRVSAQIKNSALYKHYLDIARQAVSEHMHNNDPLQGRTQYNHRFNGDVGNRIVTGARGRNVRDPNQPVFQRYGPFENVAGQPAYIVIYGNSPQQQQPPRQQRPQQQNPPRSPSTQSVQGQQPSQ